MDQEVESGVGMEVVEVAGGATGSGGSKLAPPRDLLDSLLASDLLNPAPVSQQYANDLQAELNGLMTSLSPPTDEDVWTSFFPEVSQPVNL